MRVVVVVVVIVLSVLAGCLKASAFQCGSDPQCVRGDVQGRCDTTSYCSFPDPTCASGQRFGEYADSHSNRCVGADVDGGIVDGSTSDARLVDGSTSTCPAGYAPLPGVADRMYRKLLTAAPWANHRTACSAEGANIYLAIPDDATELSAIVTFAGADVWVGIDDITTEGSYQTVLGVAATFLPWASGEPDNGGNQDCVDALAASSQLATQQCSSQHIAVCECAP